MSIRNQEQKAKKGDIKALFQLYLNNKDDNAAEYLSQCIDYLEAQENEYPKNRIRLNELKLIYFRKFKELTITLHPKLTVIIGDNGSGKTSIVYSIAKTLGWLNARLEKQNKNAEYLKEDDINIYSPLNAEVITKFAINKDSYFSATLSKIKKGASERKDSELEDLSCLSNMYRIVNAQQAINIPLFAYYSAERFKSVNKNVAENLSDIKHRERSDVYDKAASGNGQFNDFLELFLVLDNLASGVQNKKRDHLEGKLSAYASIVKDETHSLWAELQETKTELELLNESIKHGVDFSKKKQVIINAIKTFLPSISQLYIDRSSGKAELKIEYNGNTLNFNQLSDGQKMMIGLAADIAHQLLELSPNLENPLFGQGIVVIDEIELHLHPTWQQTVVGNLQATFPNIQLILTTHSPQVLSTVDKKCIRQFSIDEHGKPSLIKPRFQTKGVASSDILARIMGTPSVPDIEEAKLVEQFSIYLSNQKKEEAEALLIKIKQHFGTEHPVVNDCLNQIKIFEMKVRMSGLTKSKD